MIRTQQTVVYEAIEDAQEQGYVSIGGGMDIYDVKKQMFLLASLINKALEAVQDEAAIVQAITDEEFRNAQSE
jgi:hypothetical protein